MFICATVLLITAIVSYFATIQ